MTSVEPGALDFGITGPLQILPMPSQVVAGWIQLRERHAVEGAGVQVAFQIHLGYCGAMEDLKLEVPAAEEVEVDAKTLAAIDRGAADANAGRVVSLEDARRLVPQWICKFESQKPR